MSEVVTPPKTEVPTTAEVAKPADVVQPVVTPPAAEVIPPAAQAPATALTPDAKTENTETVPPAAKVVPEKYDVKLPEGSKLTAEDLTKFTDAAKINKLSNEEAQAQLNGMSAFAEQIQERSVKTYDQQQFQKNEAQKAEWFKAAQSDPEIGGEKFKESVALATRALDKINDPALMKWLQDSGRGNDPMIIRAFARVGRGIADDKTITGGAPINGSKTQTDILYDNASSKK